jgi:tetratricopeptide (TPR) repeat protein
MATVSDALTIAIAQHQAGRLDEAEQVYRQILDVEPNHPDAWHLLGVAATAQGRGEWAAQCIGRALQLKPQWPEAHSNLGNAFKEQGKLSEAIDCYCEALRLNPDFGDAHFNLANVLFELSNIDAAISHYRRAADLRPEFAKVHYNLGLALASAGNLDAAAASYRRALTLQPTMAEAHNNLGIVLYEQARPDDAAAQYRQAIALKPNYAEPHFNLGIVWSEQGRTDEALKAHSRAIELKPDYADAHWNLSLLLLQLGDFQRGWAEHEWRWRRKEADRRHFQQPMWDGQPVSGKTILLHAEQGLGDTIQFVRFVSQIKDLGATILLEVQKPLIQLFATHPGIERLIARGDALPPFHVHAPLLSLPHILKTSLDTIPRETPYLFANAALVAQWREHLSSVAGFRIGINWRGRGGKGRFRLRDVPLECFAPLARVPGIRLISLQKGEGREELAAFHEPANIIDLGADIDETQGAFMDTAAIMMNLDLVITSDTSIPHLAGALGIPVWLVLPNAPDWRWLLDRTDSPWYPTMRLFRQKQPGDWAGVFSDVQIAVQNLLNN